MPSTVYSVRFLQVAALAGSTSVTVPAGVVWIVRDIDAIVRTGAVGGFVDAGVSGILFWLADYTTTATQAFQWRGRQVVHPGEPLQVTGGGGNGFDITVSGYQLTPP